MRTALHVVLRAFCLLGSGLALTIAGGAVKAMSYHLSLADYAPNDALRGVLEDEGRANARPWRLEADACRAFVRALSRTEAREVELRGRFPAFVRGYDLVPEGGVWPGTARYTQTWATGSMPTSIHQVSYRAGTEDACHFVVPASLAARTVAERKISTSDLARLGDDRARQLDSVASEESRRPAGLFRFARVGAQEMLGIGSERLQPIGEHAERLDRWIVRSLHLITLLLFAFLLWPRRQRAEQTEAIRATARAAPPARE